MKIGPLDIVLPTGAPPTAVFPADRKAKDGA